MIVFAYGATGAGKTHTMLGTQQNPGIIFLTVMDLYRRMEELRGTKKFEISVSYLEVKVALNCCFKTLKNCIRFPF
jgi:kinesin family protein 18/19